MLHHFTDISSILYVRKYNHTLKYNHLFQLIQSENWSYLVEQKQLNGQELKKDFFFNISESLFFSQYK